MTMDLFYTGLSQGLILALIAYAVMIPFRLLNFPDLTAEGAYPLGGAICAVSLLMGLSPLMSMILAALGAGLMCVITGIIHLRLQINTLLAGIILSTMVYSVNLRILSKPNVSLFEMASIFPENQYLKIMILLGILLGMVIPLVLFLKTELGLKLRAVGLNLNFSKRQGISVSRYTLFGLFVAGCFTGLAGSLMIQMQQYMDVGMGAGIVIHALAAMMIGEAVLGKNTLEKQLISPLIGALLYQQIQGLALSFGLAPSDLKFFTGSVVLLVIAMQKRGRHA